MTNSKIIKLFTLNSPVDSGPHQHDCYSGRVLRVFGLTNDARLLFSGYMVERWLKDKRPDLYDRVWSWGNGGFKINPHEAREILRECCSDLGIELAEIE